MLTFKTVKQAVSRLAFSADGSRVAAAGEARKIHVWNLTAAKHKRAVIAGLSEPAAFLAFRPDGKLFAITRFGQSVLYDPATGATGLHAPEVEGWVGDVVTAPDFSAFYGTGWRIRKWTFDGGLRQVWEEFFPEQGFTGHGGAALTPEGEYLAAVSSGRGPTLLHARNTETGALLAVSELADEPVRAFTLFPDGRTLVFVRYGWGTGRPAHALVAGPRGGPFEVVRASGETDGFTALALHPSGRLLAVGQEDGLVRVLDTHDWSEVAVYRWTGEAVRCLTFAPDGLKAAVGFGHDGQFVVWDMDL